MGNTWNRIDLKERGKTAFKKNYWAAVIVSVILAIVTASGSSNGAANSAERQYHNDYYEEHQLSEGGLEFVSGEDYETSTTGENLRKLIVSPVAFIVGLFSLSAALLLAVLGFILHFFVGNVFEVGCRGFYIENMYSNPGIGKMLGGFKSGAYGNIVKTMFLRDLYIFLWTLLFVIPGIIKTYEYRMVPYLLAEYPDMPTEEAFRRSRDMMYGEKMNAFVLDLSFIPWILLSAFTFRIAGLFYVNPYVDAVDAELYDALAGGTAGGNTGGYDNYGYN